MHTDTVNTEHSEHWLGLDDSDNRTCGHGGYSEKIIVVLHVRNALYSSPKVRAL